MKPETRRKNRKNPKNAFTKKRRVGGGWTDILLGASRIRGQKYEHWLEERLVLYFSDINFVNQVRQRFGYNTTSLYTFDYNSVKKNLCARPTQDQKLILGDKKVCDVQQNMQL